MIQRELSILRHARIQSAAFVCEISPEGLLSLSYPAFPRSLSCSIVSARAKSAGLRYVNGKCRICFIEIGVHETILIRDNENGYDKLAMYMKV